LCSSLCSSLVKKKTISTVFVTMTLQLFSTVWPIWWNANAFAMLSLISLCVIAALNTS